MKTLVLAVLAFACANLLGCATVPEASIELSATIGRDLDAVHASHRALAELHFDDLRRRIDAFVDEEYRPYVLRAMMTELDVTSELEAALAGESDLDVLDIMSIVVEESIARIATFRTEMLAPVEAQRRQTLAAIDRAYRQLQSANAVVTGHLASIRDVHDAQAELMADASLEDLRGDMTRRLAAMSEGVGRVLDDARAADRALDDLPARVDEVVADPR
ncbi:hypothetical protein GF314_06150 [bacterium]|nr:hypothetical protein [bacterium]